MLTKAGGSFVLTSAVDFGATHGVKSTYFSSRATAATAGIVRLANNETVSWRNAANTANLELKAGASNKLEFAGNPVLTLALGAANTSLRMNAGGTDYEWGAITNAQVDASAAIAYSKLALSGSIVNSDIASSAAIAYSKLSLSGSVVNADIATTAAIAHSKMAALTASRALVSDASGVVSASSVTSTEIGYVSGVTSSIQTQLDAKQASDADLTAVAALSGTGMAVRTAADTWTTRSIAVGSSKLTVSNASGAAGNPTLDVDESALTLTNIGGTLSIAKGGTGQTTASAAMDALSPTTTKGDLIAHNGTNNVRVAVGGDGQVLTADSAQASGLSWTSPLVNPMTAVGDIIIGGTVSGGSAAATRLGVGGANTVLRSDGTNPNWGSITNAHIDSSAAIAHSKLEDGSALSVLGRSANSAGSLASIAAGMDHHVLRRSGTSLGFGLITNDNIATGASIAASKLDLETALTLGPSSSDGTTHTVRGSITQGTAIPSFSSSAFRYIGTKFSNLTNRLDSTANSGLALYAGGYFDGTGLKRSAANQTAVRLSIRTQTSASSAAFVIEADPSVSHSADSTASFTSIGSATAGGVWTFPGGVTGVTTSSSAAAGIIGEYVENVRSTNSPAITNGTYFSIDSGNSTFNDDNETGITLTAGDWDISASAYLAASGGAAISQYIVFIGTAKGTSTTGQDVARAFQIHNASYTASTEQTAAISPYRVSISSTTTYYLKCRVNHSGGGSVVARGSIRARRVR